MTTPPGSPKRETPALPTDSTTWPRGTDNELDFDAVLHMLDDMAKGFDEENPPSSPPGSDAEEDETSHSNTPFSQMEGVERDRTYSPPAKEDDEDESSSDPEDCSNVTSSTSASRTAAKIAQRKRRKSKKNDTKPRRRLKLARPPGVIIPPEERFQRPHPKLAPPPRDIFGDPLDPSEDSKDQKTLATQRLMHREGNTDRIIEIMGFLVKVLPRRLAFDSKGAAAHIIKQYQIPPTFHTDMSGAKVVVVDLEHVFSNELGWRTAALQTRLHGHLDSLELLCRYQGAKMFGKTSPEDPCLLNADWVVFFVLSIKDMSFDVRKTMCKLRHEGKAKIAVFGWLGGPGPIKDARHADENRFRLFNIWNNGAFLTFTSDVALNQINDLTKLFRDIDDHPWLRHDLLAWIHPNAIVRGGPIHTLPPTPSNLRADGNSSNTESKVVPLTDRPGDRFEASEFINSRFLVDLRDTLPFHIVEPSLLKARFEASTTRKFSPTDDPLWGIPKVIAFGLLGGDQEFDFECPFFPWGEKGEVDDLLVASGILLTYHWPFRRAIVLVTDEEKEKVSEYAIAEQESMTLNDFRQAFIS